MSDLVDTSPWKAYSLGDIYKHGKPEAMLKRDEMLYLYWLAREYYKGKGDIIDLGPLTGGSTVCFAGGLADNKNVPDSEKYPVQSYDLFVYDGLWGDLSKRGIFPGDDFFNLFAETIAPCSHMVNAHKGDIFEVTEYDRDIEFLFVDLAKSPALFQHVAKVFFPKVILSDGLVIHQDYRFSGMPYLKAFQETFHDCFELIPFARDVPTVAFRLIKELPDDFDQQVDALSNLSGSELITLIDRARDRFEGTDWLIMESSSISQLVLNGSFDEAEERFRKAVVNKSMNDAARNWVKIAISQHPQAGSLTKLL
ncbi:MAG: hypothetical protein AAF217_11630 [Pseudomonadota bacterium]